MNLEDIEKVEVDVSMGREAYRVTTVDGLNMTVPSNPSNKDYPVVQEWLAKNTKVSSKKGAK
jgi:hypothetical protein